MKRYLPTNHTVVRATLENIRIRHRLLTDATQYAPGKYEIGYGNRNDVALGMRISACQAEDLLRNDVMYVEAFIRLAVASRITDGCYQALVSFLYDVGPKSQAARIRLAALHERGEDGFFLDLSGEAEASRFNADIGRTARFFELKLSQI